MPGMMLLPYCVLGSATTAVKSETPASDRVVANVPGHKLVNGCLA